MSKTTPTQIPPLATPLETSRSPLRLALIGLALGFATQFLFFDRSLGISFPVMTLLFAAAVLLAAAWERRRPSPESYVLAAAALGFSTIVAVRLEPLTVFLAVCATFGLLILLARTLLPGRILSYGWLDLAWAQVIVPLEAWIRPWGVLQDATARLLGERVARSRMLAMLRGLLLALPVVALFSALLASADLVFAEYLEEILRWLNLERIVELLQRGAVMAIGMVFLLGVIVLALRQRRDRPRIGEGRTLLAPFVGFTEAAVVLAAVDALFAAFVAVQFTYLFGGEENIVRAGFTYSEYARRGFGELVGVAALSLGMILGLAAWSRREEGRQRMGFQAASAVLVLLIGVMLASAFLRLQLYEQAYGFTRLRTYTHAAILWMGALFLAFLVLLWADRLRGFALAAAAACLGFTATLAATDVDAFIVRHNVERFAAGGEIDIDYLLQLTDDATPGLVDLHRGHPAVRGDLDPRLACRRQVLARRIGKQAWPESHISRARAWQALQSIQTELSAHVVRMRGSQPFTWTVEIDGGLVGCFW